MLRNIAAAVKEVVVGWARSIGDAIKRQVEPARTAVGAVARAGCDAVRPRAELIAENALLRQQLIVIRRQINRPVLNDS